MQNDTLKEYLARGTYVFPPAASQHLTADLIAFTCREIPRWNPINICSYHLREAGATPEQEVAFALANACAVLDAVRASGQVADAEFPRVVGRISFFVNAGIRFVAEMCKMRAFTELWDEICRERYGIEEAKYRRFRYGVQVNSLDLTEQQPENNVYRILLEMLAVVLSKDARARAVQLPAWNEALGLPRPWDQQWSLRLQQVVAFETDLLEHEDLFAGNPVVEEKVERLKALACVELAEIDRLGGAVAAIEAGHTKRRLVESQAARLTDIEEGRRTVVGVNAFTDSAPSPLAAGADGGFLAAVEGAEDDQLAGLRAWREGRDEAGAQAALDALAGAARRGGEGVMEASIACAHAGVTTGEWADALRQVFGEYRPPTGLDGVTVAPPESAGALRLRVEEVSARLGHRLRILVGKPGLDGHSNGAEQIALRAREAGIEVLYDGIRQSPAQIARRAVVGEVDLVGLSILSGSHMALARDVIGRLAQAGRPIPVVVGGIVPAADRAALEEAGVARIYSPKDYELSHIIGELVTLVARDNLGPA